uniref:Putative folliculin-interacting protein 1 n=1 Tax=Ixodes ricinus TaxID=34613 RepID=A0A0K8R7N8_IXORI
MQDTHVTDSFRWDSMRKKCHICMLCLLPWLLLHIPTGVSARHMESECLLQQPGEEGHWIQSLEPLPAP